jgi:hypothetical protein
MTVNITGFVRATKNVCFGSVAAIDCSLKAVIRTTGLLGKQTFNHSQWGLLSLEKGVHHVSSI